MLESSKLRKLEGSKAPRLEGSKDRTIERLKARKFESLKAENHVVFASVTNCFKFFKISMFSCCFLGFLIMQNFEASKTRALGRNSQLWLQKHFHNIGCGRRPKRDLRHLWEPLSSPQPHSAAALDLLKRHSSNLVKKHSEATFLSEVSLFTTLWAPSLRCSIDVYKTLLLLPGLTDCARVDQDSLCPPAAIESKTITCSDTCADLRLMLAKPLLQNLRSTCLKMLGKLSYPFWKALFKGSYLIGPAKRW